MKIQIWIILSLNSLEAFHITPLLMQGGFYALVDEKFEILSIVLYHQLLQGSQFSFPPLFFLVNQNSETNLIN